MEKLIASLATECYTKIKKKKEKKVINLNEMKRKVIRQVDDGRDAALNL